MPVVPNTSSSVPNMPPKTCSGLAGEERTRTEKGSSIVPCRLVGLFGWREILAHSLGCSCHLAQRGDGILVHRVELRLDIVLVFGDFGGQTGHLNGCRPGHDAQHGEAQDGRHQHRRNPAQPPPLQPVTHRAQQEAQQHGQRQGNQHPLGQVKSRNDHGDRRQRQHPRWFGIRACGARLSVLHGPPCVTAGKASLATVLDSDLVIDRCHAFPPLFNKALPALAILLAKTSALLFGSAPTQRRLSRRLSWRLRTLRGWSDGDSDAFGVCDADDDPASFEQASPAAAAICHAGTNGFLLWAIEALLDCATANIPRRTHDV